MRFAAAREPRVSLPPGMPLARPPVPRAAPTPFARAVEGVTTPVFYGKRQCSERRVFDDRALLRLLRGGRTSSSSCQDTRFT